MGTYEWVRIDGAYATYPLALSGNSALLRNQNGTAMVYRRLIQDAPGADPYLGPELTLPGSRGPSTGAATAVRNAVASPGVAVVLTEYPGPTYALTALDFGSSATSVAMLGEIALPAAPAGYSHGFDYAVSRTGGDVFYFFHSSTASRIYATTVTSGGTFGTWTDLGTAPRRNYVRNTPYMIRDRQGFGVNSGGITDGAMPATDFDTPLAAVDVSTLGTIGILPIFDHGGRDGKFLSYSGTTVTRHQLNDSLSSLSTLGFRSDLPYAIDSAVQTTDGQVAALLVDRSTPTWDWHVMLDPFGAAALYPVDKLGTSSFQPMFGTGPNGSVVIANSSLSGPVVGDIWVLSPQAPAVVPPLRQYPRTDGLATSSARRLYPVSRSRQRSLRRGGGAYL